jgi:hypothetical protein
MEDVNVSTDIALCRHCGRTYAFSEIVSGAPAGDLSMPPNGAWYEVLADGFRVGATTRSAAAFFIVPFMCVWSGFSLGGIYGTQLRSGHFNLFSSLFGIPFLIGTLLFGSYALMTVAGKVEVTQRGDQLTIFTGVGTLGWRRRYLASEFSTVHEGLATGARFGSNRQGMTVVLEGSTRAELGAMLSQERRYFLLNALRRSLSGQATAQPLAQFR